MATIERTFSAAAQARNAIEHLHGMGILGDSITLTEAPDDADGGGWLLIAEVPDGQRTAAEALLDRAASQPVSDEGADGYDEETLRRGTVDDGSIDVGADSPISAGLAGPAMSGGTGITGMAAVDTNIRSQELVNEIEDREERTTRADSPDDFSGGGATGAGTDYRG